MKILEPIFKRHLGSQQPALWFFRDQDDTVGGFNRAISQMIGNVFKMIYLLYDKIL